MANLSDSLFNQAFLEANIMASMAEIRAKLLANQKGGNNTQRQGGGDNA
jgi:hypothetical protein